MIKITCKNSLQEQLLVEELKRRGLDVQLDEAVISKGKRVYEGDDVISLIKKADREAFEEKDEKFLDEVAKREELTIPAKFIPRNGKFHYKFKVWNYNGNTIWVQSGEQYNDPMFGVRGTHSLEDIVLGYLVGFKGASPDADKIESAITVVKSGKLTKKNS